MIKNVHEILDEFEKAETPEAKKQVLVENNLFHFKEVLKYTFDPEIQFYTEDAFPADYERPDTFPGIRIAGIESEIRRVYLFIKGNPTADILTPEKRHVLLLQLLESFEPKEARIWFNMMHKDLKIEGLTKELVQETYPELF